MFLGIGRDSLLLRHYQYQHIQTHQHHHLRAYFHKYQYHLLFRHYLNLVLRVHIHYCLQQVQKECFRNHQKYHYDYKYKKQGEFWNQNRDFKSITSIINKVLNYNTTDWSNIYKKYSKQILVFDKKNKTKKSIINKILGKK